MKQDSHFFHRYIFKRVGYLLGLSLLPWCYGISVAQASVQFEPPPPDQGAPTGRQRGGGTRSDCFTYQGLTALIPQVEGTVWSQTTSASPSFFFYVPHELDSTQQLEFVIQDSEDNYVFHKEFSVNAAAGILDLPITDDGHSTGLDVDKSYTWTFSIYCDATRPSDSVSVSGTVKRVADSLTSLTLNNNQPLHTPEMQFQLIEQYAGEGVWHEALGLAISLYQTNPQNPEYIETLETLFSQAELADIMPTMHVFSVEDS